MVFTPETQLHSHKTTYGSTSPGFHGQRPQPGTPARWHRGNISPAKRAVGMRKEPHIYTWGMEQVLALGQLSYLFTFDEQRQAHRALSLLIFVITPPVLTEGDKVMMSLLFMAMAGLWVSSHCCATAETVADGVEDAGGGATANSDDV